MKLIGFHTPELPASLGLDLAELEGGGACPSQFHGKTHDGLDVFVRYRGGTLRIHVANEPGDDALRDGRCILEAHIGPPLDGTMSMTQFCTNFGVTINGSIPDETDPEADRHADLTGQTTFWDAHLSRITIETSRKIVASACSTFPEALLVKALTYDSFKLQRLELTAPEVIDTLSVWLIDGPSRVTEIDSSPDEYILPKAGQLQISISYPSWRYPSPKFTYHLHQAEKDLGVSLFVPGDRNMPREFELAIDTLMLRTRFPKEDHATRNALASLGEVISQQLPITKLERIDLATGNSLGSFERPLDPVIANWCMSGADRWVEVDGGIRNAPWVGLRPAIQRPRSFSAGRLP